MTGIAVSSRKFRKNLAKKSVCILFFLKEIVYDMYTERNNLIFTLLGRGNDMAKKLKFKPTPAGIMFLSAIGVLLIAIIIMTVVLARKCSSKEPDPTRDAESSAEPNESAEPSLEPEESAEPTPDPDETTDPNETPDPNGTTDPNTTPNAGDPTGPDPIVITTPGTSTTSASPAASASPSAMQYYTSPTSTMKKNAQKGYVSADSVNMRKEPNKNSKLVQSKIAKNTAVTLYVEQKVGNESWWFLKCGDKYGYIRSDYIKKGSAPTSAATGDQTGKVVVSKIALRKSADSKSECIKEYESGTTVTILSSSKDSSGKTWYYVKTSDGKKGYMYAEYIKIDKK